MKNFVKSFVNNNEAFHYLRNKFPKLNEAIVKELCRIKF